MLDSVNHGGCAAGDTDLVVQVMTDTTCIDVGPFLQHKIEAIMAHRSQFPIQPHMLPHTILRELMGQEYFVRVSTATAVEPEFLALQSM